MVAFLSLKRPSVLCWLSLWCLLHCILHGQGRESQNTLRNVSAQVPEQVAQQSDDVRRHFLFPSFLTEGFYFDRFEDGATFSVNFSFAFSNLEFHDYALACRYLLSPKTMKGADHIAGCFSDLAFSHRNMMLKFIQEMTYSAIFVAAKAIPPEQVHSHAGALLAATYALPSAPKATSTKLQRKMCLFGKFSLKLAYFVLSMEATHVVFLNDLDVANSTFLDIMNIFEVTAKANQRSFTVTHHGRAVYRYDPVTGSTITDTSLLAQEQIICDGILVWGTEKLLFKAIKYGRLRDTPVVSFGKENDPVQVIFIREFNPRHNASRPTRTNALYSGKRRLNKLTDKISWTGSLNWPTVTAIQTRRNVFGHVQQEFELSMVHNSTQADTWFGVLKGAMGQNSTTESDVLLTFDALTGNISSPRAASGRRTCHHGRHQHLIIISYTNEIFFQNALGLRQAINSLNIADVIATGDTTLDRIYDIVGTKYVSECKLVQIVIGPHEPNWLMETYIVYDAEQVWSVFMDIPAYISLLKEAAAVFVMSPRHARKYERIDGFNVSNVYAVPFYTALPSDDDTGTPDQYVDRRIVATAANTTDPLVESFLRRDGKGVDINGIRILPTAAFPMERQYRVENKSVDVLFFGSCSDHRREFLSILDSAHDVYAARGRRKPLNMNLKCISDWKQALIGSRRDIVVQSAKIVVNIHVFPQSSLEVHRLNYLLALGKCVISERSLQDPQLDDSYREGVLFGDSFEHIVKRIFELLGDESQRALCEQRARRMYERAVADTEQLRLALDNILPFVR